MRDSDVPFQNYVRNVRLAFDKTCGQRRRQLGPDLVSQLSGRAWIITQEIDHERQHNQMALATWWRSTSWQEFQFPMLEHELKSSLFAFVALKVCLWRHGEKQSWSPTGSSNVPWRRPGRGEEESTVPSPWPLHPLVILFVLDKMMMMMMDVKSLWRTLRQRSYSKGKDKLYGSPAPSRSSKRKAADGSSCSSDKTTS
jgi:hypothetical protein